MYNGIQNIFFICNKIHKKIKTKIIYLSNMIGDWKKEKKKKEYTHHIFIINLNIDLNSDIGWLRKRLLSLDKRLS